jgi:acylphosphatase
LADWGVYKEPIPKEVLIHNLEDGGVVIYYNGQADEKIVNELEELVSSYSTKVVLMPDTDLEDLITLTAWQRIDRLNEFDKNRIIEFIEAFRGIDHH